MLLVLNQSPISTVFSIVRFPGGTKTVLSRELLYVTFHEQHSSGYGFPSLLLATRASADVSELVFKHEWRSHKCLKTIPTHPLRHTWSEVVMGNHTRSSAVHGRSFHKGLLVGSDSRKNLTRVLLVSRDMCQIFFFDLVWIFMV